MSTPTRTAPVYDAGTVLCLLDKTFTGADFADVPDPPTATDGFITFYDPGWSILRLRKELIAVFCPQDWYDKEHFAKLEELPRYRQLQMEAVKDSFGKTFEGQRQLLSEDEEIPSARVVLMGMVIHFLATGERLFLDHWVRCVDQKSDGYLVIVGDFDRDGVRVYYDPPGYSGGSLGVVLSRKF